MSRPGIGELAMLCANMPIAIKLWSGPDEVIYASIMHLKFGLMCSEGVFPCIPVVSINVFPGA